MVEVRNLAWMQKYKCNPWPGVDDPNHHMRVIGFFLNSEYYMDNGRPGDHDDMYFTIHELNGMVGYNIRMHTSEGSGEVPGNLRPMKKPKP